MPGSQVRYAAASRRLLVCFLANSRFGIDSRILVSSHTSRTPSGMTLCLCMLVRAYSELHPGGGRPWGGHLQSTGNQAHGAAETLLLQLRMKLAGISPFLCSTPLWLFFCLFVSALGPPCKLARYCHARQGDAMQCNAAQVQCTWWATQPQSPT